MLAISLLVVIANLFQNNNNESSLEIKNTTPEYIQANYLTVKSINLSDKLFTNNDYFFRYRLVLVEREGNYSAFLEILKYDRFEEVIVEFNNYYEITEKVVQESLGIFSIRFMGWEGNTLTLATDEKKVVIELVGVYKALYSTYQ